MPTARVQSVIRLDGALYAKLVKLAKREGISINEWLARAAAERVEAAEKAK